jgi:hypothetical protein
LSVFDGSPGTSYLVPLYANIKPGELDPVAITRVAKDAFLGDLRSFYRVSTFAQLPLSSSGNSAILTFEGDVNAVFSDDNSADAISKRPGFSDILLGGGDRKITVHYDLPPSIFDGTDAPRVATLTAAFHHVQLPDANSSSASSAEGGNPFSQGPWLELVNKWNLTWKGPPHFIPVADRRFPTKPVVQTTNILSPWAGTAPLINAANASVLVRWGWSFSLGLVESEAESVDTVHVTVRYNETTTPPSAPARITALDAAWRPVSLLNSLIAADSDEAARV